MTDECGVIQVTNVAPTTTKEQMHTLFSFVGKVLEVVLYPESESAYASRMCYVKFENVDDVCVALHLSNTVFIDRAIVVTAVLDGQIPDENTALENHPDATGSRAGLGNSMSTASDEIRRTVYVSNLDLSVTPEYLMQLFGSKAGEIKYVRMAGEESLSTRAAFIEFTHQTSVMLALSFTGQIIADHSIRVAPAATSIVKPAASSVFGVTSKEIEDALKKVNDAEPLIAAVVDPDGRHSRSVSRKRSKSPSRRSKSKSRSRRSRSPRRSRSRSHRSKRRSKSRSPRRNSRSPRRHRSKSRSPRRPVYSRLRGGRRSRSRSPRPSNRSRRSRSRDRSTKNEFKMRDSGSRGSPRYDRSSVRDNRGERDARSGKESARSKVESSRHRSRSPGKRSGAKRSRSKSRSPRREKERDKKQNSSRDRSSRDVGRDHEKVRERDRDHDKEENRGRNERKKEHRESSREKERRGCSAEEEREVSKEKDEDQSSPITKKSRGDYEDDSDLVNDRAQINAEKMSGTDTDQSD